MKEYGENKTAMLLDYDNNLLKGTILDVYDNYDDQINVAKYFYHLYHELAYEYGIFRTINLKTFMLQITEHYNITESDYIIKYEQAHHKKADKINDKTSGYIIRLKDKLIIHITSYKLFFWYGRNISFAEIQSLAQWFDEAKKKKKHKHRFYMIGSRSDSAFALKKFNVKVVPVNIEDNYNNDFPPIHQQIYSFLKDDDSNGLVLLHGKHGTGKTTYIRHLMSHINRRFIFVPMYMIDSLTSPHFMPFISNYQNSVLVLEDCEDLLTKSGSSRSNSLVNLLNVGDGLLSDALGLKVICTFNADTKQIDKAVLRKGRLRVKYEFKELEKDKARNLATKLGLNSNIPESITLADIYHLDIDDFAEKDNKKIGF